MRKDEFFQFLDKLFENASASEIKETLDKIQYGSWLDEYWKEKSEGLVECDNCGAYVELAKCKKEEFQADTYLGRMAFYKYYCPECGKLAYEDSNYV